MYVLKSILPERYRGVLALHRSPHELALLTTIIAILTLNRCDLAEEDLLGYLDSLGLSTGEKDDDSTFGSVPRLLEMFERQKYLMSYRKADEPDKMIWTIGARSKVELPPEAVAKFVGELAQICGQGNQLSNITQAFTTS